MKKTKQMLMTASLLLCANFAAAETIEYGGLNYSIDTSAKTAKVVAIGDFKYYSFKSVSVPETIDYNGETYTVTALGEGCFQCNANLESATIPKTITSIEPSTFNTCANLTSVKFADGIKVKALPAGMFNSCYKLTDVTIPQSVTSLGNNCFDECSGLTSIDIPESVNGFGSWCFIRCYSLKSVKLPNKPKSFGEGCFSGCRSLESVEIPADWTSLGSKTFSGCTSLKSINIPSGVTSIDYAVFKGCTSLMSVNIPSGVTRVWGDAFNGCTSLTSINIPSGVTYIGDNAFDGCTSLTSPIDLSSGLSYLGESSFSGCPFSKVTLRSMPTTYYGCNVGFESSSNLVLSLTDDSYIGGQGKNSNSTLATDGVTFNTVSYSRPTSTQWSTVVVPFDATLTGNESYKLYRVSGWTDGQFVALEHVDDNIKAGVSYVVYNNGDQLDIKGEMSGVTTKLQGIYLTGTYESKQIYRGYFLSGDKFWSVDYVTTQNPNAYGVTVPPFRAYFADTSSKAPSLSLSVGGGDDTTGINSAELTDVLNDGAEYYDLSGKRLQAPQRGVNIVRTASGKTVKMVIK